MAWKPEPVLAEYISETLACSAEPVELFAIGVVIWALVNDGHDGGVGWVRYRRVDCEGWSAGAGSDGACSSVGAVGWIGRLSRE